MMIVAMFGFAGLVFADSGANHGLKKKGAPPIVLNADDPTTPSDDSIGGGLTRVVAAANDTCAGAEPLTLNRISYSNTLGAADDYQSPATAACFAGIGQTPTTSPGRDVVYSFVPPTTGSYTFRIVLRDTNDDSRNQNEVLYVAADCPASGVPICLGGANRLTFPASAITYHGQNRNHGEEVTCLPLVGGVPVYAFVDNGAAGNNGWPRSGIEVIPCGRESEPNGSPATANAWSCNIGGSTDVAPVAHCYLGNRAGNVCTRSTPLVQTQPESNMRCAGSSAPCVVNVLTGADDCAAGTGPCQQQTDADCDPRCDVGPNAGLACTTNAFCNPGSAQGATCAGTCQIESHCIVTATGADTGTPCTPICVIGAPPLPTTGRYCSALSDCGGAGLGTCTANAMCATGQTCGRQYNEGDEDFYALGNVSANSKVFAMVYATAANDWDFRMRITTPTNTVQFDDDDGIFLNGDNAPIIAGAQFPSAQDLYIKVSKSTPRISEPYHLPAIVRPPFAFAQLEDESGPTGNDIYFYWPGDVILANYVTTHCSLALAQPCATDADCGVGQGTCTNGYLRGTFAGSHGPFAFDADCFKFLVHEGDLMHWYGDGEPARVSTANTQYPSAIPYDPIDEGGEGISNFIFAGNARKNVLTPNATLNGLTPAVTSFGVEWRSKFTGMMMVCYYDASVPLGLGTPGNGAWAGSFDCNCGPCQASGPNTTTAEVSVTKTGPVGPVAAGDIFTYTIAVTNHSTGPNDIAQEVIMHDTLDPNLTFISMVVDDGFSGPGGVDITGNSPWSKQVACVYTDGFQYFSGLPTSGTNDAPIWCNNASMAPGTTTTYYVTVQVNNCLAAGALIGNQATIESVSTDPDSSNNSSDAVPFLTIGSAGGSCNTLFCPADGTTCFVDQCNTGSTCDGSGACIPSPRNCDDSSLCTDDTCDPASGCVNDSTQAGDLCDDFNGCTSNACDPLLFCVFPPSPTGTACDDGLGCTNPDSCDGAGSCVGTNVCDDGNPCTDDFADEANACACSYAPSFAGTLCSDGNACTGTSGSPDACDGNGACVGGAAVSCDDGNACTADSCNPGSGCVSTPITCDDGNACNGVETCDTGTGCVAGTPLNCNDGDACNGVETCDSASGCVAGTPLTCDDGNACNGVETCNPGSGCAAGTPVTCAPADQCHLAGVCAPGTGLCSYAAKPDGTTCDDGNAGTSGDTCQGGVCTGGSSCTSSNDPKTKGWYHSLCNHPHSGDAITDADAACVGSISSTFAGFATANQVCGVLAAGGGGCDRAEDHYMALVLNICKQRVCLTNTIDSNCGNNVTVAQSENEADTLLSNPGRTTAQCGQAECLSKEINNGHALDFDTLVTAREGGSVRLNWVAPSTDDGTGAPRSYKVWRRAIGSTAPFTQIGTTTGVTFLDTSAGTGSWQYDLSSVF